MNTSREHHVAGQAPAPRPDLADDDIEFDRKGHVKSPRLPCRAWDWPLTPAVLCVLAGAVGFVAFVAVAWGFA